MPGAALFPAKFLAVLAARFESGLPGLTILPCELLEQNARRLRQLVLDQAERLEGAWPARRLAGPIGCAWPSTLVDRIVSAPPPGDELAERDPLYAVAEPYALWLMEGPVAAGLSGRRTITPLLPSAGEGQGVRA